MYGKFQQYLKDELAAIEEAGLYKKERNIESSQSAEITLADGSKALNFCANNYLGLGDNPRLIEAAKRTYDEKGYGVASVRFICMRHGKAKGLSSYGAGQGRDNGACSFGVASYKVKTHSFPSEFICDYNKA